ncbi:hypothetical protein ACF0H5_005565 [Mactra antiquata]
MKILSLTVIILVTLTTTLAQLFLLNDRFNGLLVRLPSQRARFHGLFLPVGNRANIFMMNRNNRNNNNNNDDDNNRNRNRNRNRNNNNDDFNNNNFFNNNFLNDNFFNNFFNDDFF